MRGQTSRVLCLRFKEVERDGSEVLRRRDPKFEVLSTCHFTGVKFNPDLSVYMYVRKEAVLSSQIPTRAIRNGEHRTLIGVVAATAYLLVRTLS